MALNNLIGAAIGILVLTIVVFMVTIPVVKDAITASNLTGTEATIANLIPLFLVLGVFMIITAVYVLRWI